MILQITQPVPVQYQQPLEYQRPPFMGSMGLPPNGLIMVDPNLPSTSASTSTAQNNPKTVQPPNSKKNSKKNKKKKNKEEVEQRPPMVTIRNPGYRVADPNQMLNINQPASIIKNENGMFTIRNVALQNALSSGIAPNYRLYGSDGMYQAQETTRSENFSYFSGCSPSVPSHPSSSTNPIGASSVIGQAAGASSMMAGASSLMAQAAAASSMIGHTAGASSLMAQSAGASSLLAQAAAAGSIIGQATGASSMIGQEVLRSSNSPKASATAIGSERNLRKQQQSSYASLNTVDMFSSNTNQPYQTFDVGASQGNFPF